MNLTLTSKIKLNNGIEMLRFGLGVYKSGVGAETKNAVKWALEAGYRHIDTARIYKNERDVGVAIKESGIPREEIFITTKLWNDDQGYDNTLKACEESLERLQTDYVDLYLMHWPVEKLRGQSWRAMEKLYEEKKCKAIGVSNFTIKHLEELIANASLVPAVNQVEFSPFLYQKELLDFCRSKNIQLEAYSSLTHGKRLDDPRLAEISKKYSKSPAQILIRWVLQHDIIVIPKSVHKERIIENASVFDFSILDEDMEALDALNENFRTCWDPTEIP